MGLPERLVIFIIYFGGVGVEQQEYITKCLERERILQVPT